MTTEQLCALIADFVWSKYEPRLLDEFGDDNPPDGLMTMARQICESASLIAYAHHDEITTLLSLQDLPINGEQETN